MSRRRLVGPASGCSCLGLGMRLLATYFPNLTPEMYSFVPAVAGLLLVGGWKIMVGRSSAGVLDLHVPAAGRPGPALLAPAAAVGDRVEHVLPADAGHRRGQRENRVLLGEVNMDIVEACSGLRMLTIFVALAVAITMVTDRPWWEKMIIVVSAVPIALAVNIIRITITGIMYWHVGSETVERMFHDMYGWFMMPVALGLLYVEFQVLSHLFVEEDATPPVPIDAGPNRPPRSG